MNQNANSISKSNKALALTGMIAGCLLMSFSGCRSLNSTFGSGTSDGVQLPKLAFWKKESDAILPVPPAHHLDPSLTQPLGQVAGNARGAVGDMDQSISQITKAARSNAGKLAATAASRAPYSVDDSGIEKAADALKSKFGSGQTQFGQGLAGAKDKLKSFEPNAIANSKKAISKQVASAQQGIGNSFKSAADLRGASNDFNAAIARKNAQLKSGIESAISRKPFDPALAKVNNTLYDMKGNLVSAGSSSSKSFSGTAEDARERFSAALGTLNGKAAVAAKSSTNLGSDLKNRIAATASQLKQPLVPNGGAFKSAFEKTADPVADQARGLLNQAKQKVAGLGTGFDYPESQNKPPAPSQLGNGFRSIAGSGGGGAFGGGSSTKPAVATQPKPFSGSEFGRTRVANVTPVGDQTTSGSATKTGLASTLTNAWNRGGRQSQLKPIEVINTTTTPGNVLRTASIRASDLGTSANAAIPGFGSARNVTVGHVSDIDIPQKVLSGSGSYAPGSVNKVR